MRSNRFGLADLKRARTRAAQADTAANAAPPAQVQGKRGKHGMLPPGADRAGALSAAGWRAGKTATSGNTAATPGNLAATSAQGAEAAASVPLDGADLALFRQAMRTVQPIRPANRLVLAPRPEADPEELRQRRTKAVGTQADAPRPLSGDFAPAGIDQNDRQHLRNGMGPDVLRDLQRGKWPILSSLDLHGATQELAWERLNSFLQSCLAYQVRCVRIVHGKGHGSRDGTPVLRQTVRRWLAQMPEVLAYIECAERDGGDGAVQVLLRPPPIA